MQEFLIPSKSVKLTGRLVPHSAVPGLPGAINNFEYWLLFEIFQAKACSLPPEPNSKIFINLCRWFSLANIGEDYER